MAKARQVPSRRPERLRTLCVVVLVLAALTACVNAFLVGAWLPDHLGFFGALPRGLKAVDDHGKCVLVALQVAELAGEREAIAVTTQQRRGVLRYYLMPRPVYALPDALTPALSPEYLATHRRFLEERQVRKLVWFQWQGADREELAWEMARIYDVEQALQGNPGEGIPTRTWIGAERPTRPTGYLVAALVVLLIAALGWALQPLLLGQDGPAAWAEALPRWFALGLLAHYAVFSSLMLLGATMSRGVILGVGLGMVAAATLLRAALAFVRSQGQRGAGPAPSGREGRPRPQLIPAREDWRRFSLLRIGLLAVCVALFLAVLSLAAVMPVRNVDALHHWGYAAKVFHYEAGLYNPICFDPHRGYDYRHYPILVPLTLSTIYGALGWVDDQAAKVFFAALYGMLLLAAYGAMRRERPGTGALLVVTCLAACGAYFGLVYRAGPDHHFGYNGGAVSALADVPLSFFILLGVVEWGRWAASRERGHLASWVLFLSGAAITKLEGGVILAVALAAAAFLRRRTRPLPWGRLALAAACLAALVLPWQVFVRFLPASGGFTPRSGSILGEVPRNIPSFPTNVAALAAEAGDGAHWGAFWALVLVAVGLGWRGAASPWKVLAGLLLCQLASYLAAYLLTPFDARGLAETTKMRLLLHLAPTAAYLAWCFLPPLPRWLEAPRPQPHRGQPLS